MRSWVVSRMAGDSTSLSWSTDGIFSSTALGDGESSVGVFSFIGSGVAEIDGVLASMGLDTLSSVLVSFGVLTSIAAGAVSASVFAMVVLQAGVPGHPVS